MARSSVELHSDPPIRRGPVAEATKRRALRARLIALAKVAIIGGLTFAVGLVGMVAVRSLGWAAGVGGIAGGAVLSVSVAIAWYGYKFHAWLDVIERLYTT